MTTALLTPSTRFTVPAGSTAKAPPELLLKLLLDSKERINDVDGSRKAAQLLAQYYPGK